MLPIKFFMFVGVNRADNKANMIAEAPWQDTVEMTSTKTFIEIDFGDLAFEELSEFADYLEGTAHEIRSSIELSKGE